MSKWFRFYSDAMRNPKVAALSDREFRLWVQLLSVSSENDGRLPPLPELKLVLNARLDHLLTGVERLISIGLIDRLEVGYEPHNWGKFQYKSDTSTGRVRKHREGRNVSETPPDTETEQIAASQQTRAKPQTKFDLLEDQLFEAAGIASFRDERHPRLKDLSPIRALLDKGYALDADILPVIRERSRNKTFSSWRFFEQAIVDAVRAKNSIPARPANQQADADWEARMKAFVTDGTWLAWGPKPGERGCRVPPELLKPFSESRDVA